MAPSITNQYSDGINFGDAVLRQLNVAATSGLCLRKPLHAAESLTTTCGPARQPPPHRDKPHATFGPRTKIQRGFTKKLCSNWHGHSCGDALTFSVFPKTRCQTHPRTTFRWHAHQKGTHIKNLQRKIVLMARRAFTSWTF